MGLDSENQTTQPDALLMWGAAFAGGLIPIGGAGTGVVLVGGLGRVLVTA